MKKLHIIGSGLEKIDLLTIKAYKIIKKADVILFDNLINRDILDIAPKKCIKKYVGKRPYSKSLPQETINTLITQYCATYTTVVRLKGGDPYIFGRGFEEWLWAKERGIAVEYVPGISNMQGAGLNDIPLTHRGISEGIWILTGMKSDGEMAADLTRAAQSNSTVVIYMGMRKLAEIASSYVKENKGHIPAAIIQNRVQTEQKQVICTVQDLVWASEKHQISHPAIIVIGPVVTLQFQFDQQVIDQRYVI